MVDRLKIVSVYSHKNGLEVVQNRYPKEWAEIQSVIGAVDASLVLSKISKEKTMPGKKLYAPNRLNELFKIEFKKLGWKSRAIKVQTKVKVEGSSERIHKGFRAMDFVKNKLGVEVQFGKYAFMVYNVAAKMTIFHNKGIIDAGVEIVPMKSMANLMSTGVCFLEQFKTDQEMRGVADIDIPVLIVGVDDPKRESDQRQKSAML
jgi:hypothetical protein